MNLGRITVERRADIFAYDVTLDWAEGGQDKITYTGPVTKYGNELHTVVRERIQQHYQDPLGSWRELNDEA